LLTQLANSRDVETQRRLGDGRNQLGEHLMRIGRDAEALTNLEKAIAIHKDLVRTDRADHVAAYGLAMALHNMGIFRSNRLHSTQSLEAYKEAAAILENLAPGPEDQERLRVLSLIYTNTAMVYIHYTGPSIKAIPVLMKALSIQDTLAKKGFSDPENLRIVSLIYYNLGLAHENADHDADARHYYQETIALGEKVARENPTVAGYKAALAENYRILGRFHRHKRRNKEALQALEAAASVIDKLASEHRSNTDYQKTRGLAYNSLALLQGEIGNVADAKQSFQRALDSMEPLVQAHPKNNTFIMYEAFIHWSGSSAARYLPSVLKATASDWPPATRGKHLQADGGVPKPGHPIKRGGQPHAVRAEGDRVYAEGAALARHAGRIHDPGCSRRGHLLQEISVFDQRGDHLYLRNRCVPEVPHGAHHAAQAQGRRALLRQCQRAFPGRTASGIGGQRALGEVDVQRRPVGFGAVPLKVRIDAELPAIVSDQDFIPAGRSGSRRQHSTPVIRD
jgi:tetratricopeptide (TPR) repeat protein